MSMINAYFILRDVRDKVDEASETHWQDRELLRIINQVQMGLAMHLTMIPGGWLLKSASVTPVDSVITLPSDCGKPVYLEETSTKYPIRMSIPVGDRMYTREPGAQTPPNAYTLRRSIVLNVDSYTTPCTLWYHERVPDLHAGTAGSSSGASKLYLDTGNEPRFTDDYYNDQVVEMIDPTSKLIEISSTISAYAGLTAYATVIGAPASGDFYGTISKLPDECLPVLVLKAALIALSKPSAALDDKYYERYSGQHREAWLTLKQWFATRANDARHTRITE